MEVCPIYKELGTEASVARGKISLIEAVLNGSSEVSAGFDKRMALCVSCKACTAKCPCGIKADEIIIKGREAIVKARGLHPIKKMAFALLKRRFLFDLGLRAAGVFGPIAFKKVSGRPSSVLARFPMPGLDRRRVMAPFAATPLRSRFPETVSVPNPKLRVAFFTGCSINYIYPDVGESVINVLKANNIEVVMPKMQHCCATPVFLSGEAELGKVFAKHNIETFETYNVDYIVAACGSCSLAWKHEYVELFKDDPDMKARAEKMAAKTFEISEFLVDIAPFRQDILGKVESNVTMHDPCHMSRGIKVTAQPRAILKSIPGLNFKEMSDPSRCCGAGGSFCVAHYDVSKKINQRKLADIASTGATDVATSCGMCRMHITDGLVQQNMNQEVHHVVQWLDKSYQAGQSA
jgi:glycolate oxidase iron-sulfur subunit